MALQPYIYDVYIYSGKEQVSQIGYVSDESRPGLGTYTSLPNEEYNGIVHDNLNNLQQQNIWPFDGVNLFLKGMVVSNQADDGGREAAGHNQEPRGRAAGARRDAGPAAPGPLAAAAAGGRAAGEERAASA